MKPKSMHKIYNQLFHSTKINDLSSKSFLSIGVAFVLSVSMAFAQIASGTYTIPGSYASFTAAVTDLNTNGLVGDGPVIFSVANGTYNEQISINFVNNSNYTDSVIFQSASGNSSLVTITYAATGVADNYTVRLNGADYITFKEIGRASCRERV